MTSRIRTLIVGTILFTLALAACGAPATVGKSGAQPAVRSQPTQPVAAKGQNSSQGGAKTAPATLPAVANGENNGEGGVEAALVTFTDTAQGFSIGHPGPWTQDTAFTKGVKFVGGDSSLTLEFVTPPAGINAMAYAQSDVTAVSAAFPGFKQLNLNASTEVANAIILGFNASGTSTVTGKTFTAHDERYYMPLADGRIAVLTVIASEGNYDQQGVRDIALTFKVTK